MDETVKLALDPQQVLTALKQMASQSESLAKQIESSLGKDAANAVKKLEKASEDGSVKIGGFFSNLGKRVKEDLKSAFDFSRVMAGVKFTDEIGKGAKQVLEMERAFDRLNVRLGASKEKFASFKTELGKNAAASGANLEKVLPGVEAMISRGGMKDTGALAEIGKIMSKAQVATGEDTGGLADQVVEGILARGDKVNTQTVKAAVDAAMAARNAGSFSTASEAAAAITHITPFAKQMGMNTRQTAALAAQASGAGAPGVDILSQLMEQGTQVGGQGRLNAMLGANIFKGGKLDTGALSKINLSKFAGMSQQQMAATTGFSGASGDDFVRFVDAFKRGDERFKQVLSGSDETAKAFDASTQNLASRLDRFKESLTNAGREISGGLAEATEGILSGNGSRVSGGLKQAGKGIVDNAGTLAMGTGATVAMGLLFGGGLRGLIKGGASTAMGVAEGAALKGVGVQSVYVVNSGEIGEASGGALSKLSGFAGLGKIGSLLTGLATTTAGMAAITAAGVGAVGYTALHSEPSHSTDQEMAERDRLMKENQANNGSQFGLAPEHIAQIAHAVKSGAENAKIRVENKGPMTHPSSVAPRTGR
jgi:hypothetical protein